MFANSLIIYNYTIKKLVHNLKDDLKENSFLFENEMLVRKLEKYSDPFISTTVILDKAIEIVSRPEQLLHMHHQMNLKNSLG